MSKTRFDSSDRSSWYFGAVSQQEAEVRLHGQRPGTFLVRDSSCCPGDYVLSVSQSGPTVCHYEIRSLPSQRVQIRDQEEFSDLPALLDFYMTHDLDTTTLMEPAHSRYPVSGPIQPMAGSEGSPEYVQALDDLAGVNPEDQGGQLCLASGQSGPIEAMDIQNPEPCTHHTSSLDVEGTLPDGHLSPDVAQDQIDLSRTPRAHSLPSLGHSQRTETKARFRAKRSHSLNDVTLLDKTEKFTPDIVVIENKEHYRLHCSQPGLFQCRVTNLVFKMEAEGEVTYCTAPWDRGILAQLGSTKRPAGPLFALECPQLSVCQLHLSHCEILSMGGGRNLFVLHAMDEGFELIKPSVITETHAIVNLTGFSFCYYGLIKDDAISCTSTSGLLAGVIRSICYSLPLSTIPS